MSYQELLEQRMKCITQQEDILNLCQKENRNMTVDEKSTFDNLDEAISGLEDRIEAMKKFQDKVKDPRFNTSNQETDVIPTDIKDSDSRENGMDGFNTFGEMLQAVARTKMPYGRCEGAGMVDERLIYTNAATGHNTSVPSEGGFLVTPQRSNEIMKKMYDGGMILSACSQYTLTGNNDSLEIPYVDETSRATGSRWGGLRAYRAGEADTVTASETKLGLWECRVTDLKAIVYITERCLEDASILQSIIEEQLPQEFTFKLEDEIIRGTGGIQCKGIVGDPATVSVAKESGQTADTIVSQNVMKMYTRCWGRSRNKAAWYINQDIETELFQMVLSVGTGGVPVYMPANGLSTSPYGTLFGKPVKPVEQCDTLGNVGDIIFGDFGEYATVKKGGFNSASSMHVRFLYDEMVFKFSMRINGKPKWKTALTPYKGTSTLSPFVTLAERA